MNKCSKCHREVDYLGNAYLPRRKQIEGVCTECKEHLEQEGLREFAEEIIELLANHTNGNPWKELGTALSKALQRQHRYLQSEVIHAFWQLFHDYKNAPHDARNEHVVKLAGQWDNIVGQATTGDKLCPICSCRIDHLL